MSVIRLGTRGSRLATTQSGWVARQLEARAPGVRVELVEIRTSGDRIQDVPLGPHLGQSFFTKEIEDALLDGRVDLAVHSCKDLATEMVPGLALAALPEREDPRDALVSSGLALHDLPPGARVGTSSPRRKGFLAAARPDLVLQDLRGNVPTRLEAVDDGRAEAIILAVSGLRRLGLEGRITEALDPELMVPAASQGALALQIREDDLVTAKAVSLMDDPDTRARVTAERACLRTLEAGCHAPVGALARIEGHILYLDAAVATPDGVVRAHEPGRAHDADAIGVAVAAALLDALGLASLRDATWAGAPPQRLADPSA